MKKPLLLTAAVAAALIGSLATAPLDGAEYTKRAGPAAAKVEKYAVVQIGDEFRVVTQSEVASLQKSTAEEDKRKLKEYQDSKKGTGKDKEKYDMPKPVKRTVRVLKKSLKTQQDANDWLEKHLREKDESKAGKKTAVW